MPLSMPSCRILVLVTNRSSPTSCTFLPRRSFRCFQPSQSPSCMPSSMLTIGYLSTQVARMSVHSRSEEHTSELQSQFHLVCRLLLEKKKHSTVQWSVIHTSGECLLASGHDLRRHTPRLVAPLREAPAPHELVL